MQKHNDYCEIKISDILANDPFPYDIYIRISEEKFLKVATSGAGLTESQIDNYAKKRVDRLYLKKTDFASFLGIEINDNGVETLNPTAQLFFDEFYSDAEITIDLLQSNEMNEILYESAKTVVDNIIKVLGLTNNAFAVLNALANSDKNDNTHSIAVSLFSVMLCQNHPWPLSQNTNKIGMAGFLHDVGKSENEEIYFKNLGKNSADTRARLVKHAAESAQILMAAECIPQDIIGIVQHHHDDFKGLTRTGSKAKVNPLSQIVAICDAFSEYTLSKTETRLPAAAAVVKIRLSKEFDTSLVDLLADTFTADKTKVENLAKSA